MFSSGRVWSRNPAALSPAFPLKLSWNSRYLVDQLNRPFQIRGYACWSLISSIASPSDLQNFLSFLQSHGVNTLYVLISDHDEETYTARPSGTGPHDYLGDYPFLKDTSNNNYAGTGGGTTITADMSTTSSTYFSWVDTVLSTCQAYGFLVMLFPSYLGFQGGAEGWYTDMNASGATKVTTFGTFVGNRYKNQENIIWMAYGDVDPTTLTNAVSLEVDLINAIKGAGANQLWGGHLPVGGGDPIHDNATIGASIDLRSIYAWTISSGDDSPEYTLIQTACGQSPTAPAFFFDDDGYEFDPDNAPAGDGGSTSANTVRKRKWWSLLSGTAGVTFGNFAMQVAGGDGTAAGGGGNPALTGTFSYMTGSRGTSLLLSDGHKHFAVLCAFMQRIAWWTLLPAGVGSIGTIVSSGGGTSGQQNYVVSAAAPEGNLCVAYIPPAGGTSITIASGIMTVGYTAYWVDPTSGIQSKIGSFGTGAQSFTVPSGSNSYGAQDWVLYLQG